MSVLVALFQFTVVMAMLVPALRADTVFQAAGAAWAGRPSVARDRAAVVKNAIGEPTAELGDVWFLLMGGNRRVQAQHGCLSGNKRGMGLVG